jgi:hypothetical protein
MSVTYETRSADRQRRCAALLNLPFFMTKKQFARKRQEMDQFLFNSRINSYETEMRLVCMTMINVLEHLYEGRTKEAIAALESDLRGMAVARVDDTFAERRSLADIVVELLRPARRASPGFRNLWESLPTTEKLLKQEREVARAKAQSKKKPPAKRKKKARVPSRKRP